MKTSKKLMALALAGTMAASSLSMVSVSAEPKKATIGVCFYQDTGKAVDATKKRRKLRPSGGNIRLIRLSVNHPLSKRR